MKQIPQNPDQEYLSLCEDVLTNGNKKLDRTGTGTISVFVRSIRFNLKNGFQLLTTKKVHFKSILHELIWFLNGETNIKYLVDNNVNIWVGDAYQKFLRHSTNTDVLLSKEEFKNLIKKNIDFAKINGELGPVYGKQWRDWNGIDQIKDLIDSLKNNPDDRRMIVSAWRVDQIKEMTLPPCHNFFQCYTRELSFEERCSWFIDNHYETGMEYEIILQTARDFPSFLENHNVPKRALSLAWNQRSNDLFLGIPFNIASYAILLNLLASVTNMIPEELIGTLGDVHIYLNHIDAVKEQLSRDPLKYRSPLLKIEAENIPQDLKNLNFKDIQLLNYQSYPSIVGELSN